MRSEIVQALAHVKQLRSQQHAWDASSITGDPIEGGHYRMLLSPAHQQALENLAITIQAIRTCCTSLQGVVSVDMGTTTSLLVDCNHDNQLMIEFSLDGSLAAVFPYGSVPTSVISAVTQCLTYKGITLLTDSERRELESQDIYTTLF